MNALLLPGNSSRHSEWIEKLKDALSPHFKTQITQHYRHWQTGEEWADIEYEMTVAKGNIHDLIPYVIIAKSIGTTIATRGVAEGILHPEKIILLGVPISSGVTSELFMQWLKQITVPVTIVQNTADPLGSFADVRSAFEEVGENLSFVESSGDTHDYIDFDAIAKLI